MKQENPHPPVDFSLAEVITKLIGATAAVLLILSAAFDFSYLYALGISFEEVPTNVSDHVRSALVWAPKVAVYALAFALYEMGMQRIEGGLSEDEIVERSRNPKFTRLLRKSPRYFFIVVVATATVSDALINNSNRGLYFGALLAWGTLSIWLVRHPRLGTRFSSTGGRLFVVLPIVGIWISFLGYNQGRAVLEKTSPVWTISQKLDSSQISQQLLGIRRFSSSAVIVSVDRKVSVIPNESILSASVIRSAVDSPTRLCAWLNIGCSHPQELK